MELYFLQIIALRLMLVSDVYKELHGFFYDGGTEYQFQLMVNRVVSYIMTKLKISIEFLKLKVQSLF